MKPKQETKLTNQPPKKLSKEELKKLVDEKKKQVKDNQIIRKWTGQYLRIYKAKSFLSS